MVLLFTAGAETQTVSRYSPEEQSHFNCELDFAEQPIQKPVRLPLAALQTLSKDKEVIRCLKYHELSSSELPSKWFVASEIHLDGPHERDIVVLPAILNAPIPPEQESENACLLGANVGPFWILRKTSQGFDIVLSESAHDLEVLSSRTYGHRDIRLVAMTATTITTVDFKFNGKTYLFNGSKSGPIR
jgi:hypothetical protein